jgi:hypothetical protein
MKVGSELAKENASRQEGLRLVVSVPTEHFASFSVVLGAVGALAECNNSLCEHRRLDGIQRRVSCYFDKHIQDKEAWRDTQGQIRVGQSIFTKWEFSINRLPDGFPERRRIPRSQQSKFQAELIDLAAAFGETLALAGIRRSATSAHPVLVLGRYSDLVKDIELARSKRALNGRHALGLIAPGRGLDKWFQHPVIVVDNIRESLDASWLDSVRPRLIVRVGRAGVSRDVGLRWPGTPHVVVLSRRSPSSIDAVETIRAMGWKRIRDIDQPPPLAISKPPGLIEAEWFIENVLRTQTNEVWDNDEW